MLEQSTIDLLAASAASGVVLGLCRCLAFIIALSGALIALCALAITVNWDFWPAVAFVFSCLLCNQTAYMAGFAIADMR